MCSALVSAHGLKHEIYSSLVCFFGSWIKERDTLMCSALVSANGLKTLYHLL